MSLKLAVKHARSNPILPKGRNSISRFCSVLTNGRQTFLGLNTYRTHPLQRKFGSNDNCIHIHSEVDAVVKATRWLARRNGKHYSSVDDLSDFTIYIARVLKDGTPSIAAPCEGCQRLLIVYNIGEVYWTV